METNENLALRQPALELPRLGRRFEIGNLTLDHNGVTSYEAYFRETGDVLSIPLKSVPSRIAINSDRVAPVSVMRHTLQFMPRGATVYAQCDDPAREVVVIRCDPALRHSLQQEMGVSDRDIRPLSNFPAPHAHALGDMLHRFLVGGAQGGRLAAESLAGLIMAQTVLALGQQDPDMVRMADMPPSRIRRVIDYIDAHLDRELSLSELADIGAMNVYHFIRRFKEYLGISPHAYVMARRVERAKDLLRHSARPIAQIAFECGFSSQSHLNTVFKRHTAVTPGRYRKDVRF